MTDCNHEYRIVDGHHTCINCGEVDIDRLVFCESVQPIYNHISFITENHISEKN